MELTNDQKAALRETRQVIYERLKPFHFTDEMLRDKSLFQLLHLLTLMVGHRNYLGTFSNTCYTLEEIFGSDAFWNKPEQEKEPENEVKSEDQKPVVH